MHIRHLLLHAITAPLVDDSTKRKVTSFSGTHFSDAYARALCSFTRQYLGLELAFLEHRCSISGGGGGRCESSYVVSVASNKLSMG
jgi:hypothetical protein